MADSSVNRSGAVVLLSGGLDSAVMTGMALRNGAEVWPLFVRQGLIWERGELAATRNFLAGLKKSFPRQLRPLSVSRMDAPKNFSARWAVDADVEPPDVTAPDETVYLPGRNLALLTVAASLARAVGVGRLQLGILAGNPFPDAKMAFFRAFENAAERAMEWRVRVETPLARMRKTEVLIRGEGLKLERTLSCIRPVGRIHCGACAKCAERWNAFLKAGIPDPTRYARRR